MKEIYTFFSLRSVFMLSLSVLLTSNSVWGQQCGPVVENFDNTGGSTAGFTGNFIYGSLGTNGYLAKDKILSFAEYTVTTPTYQLPSNQTIVGYGFTLGGSVHVATVSVSVQYVSTVTQEVITVPTSPDAVPTYTGDVGTVCNEVSFAALPGFPTGGKYRLVFTLHPASGTGLPGDVITFDDYRTNGTISLSPLPVTFIAFEAQKVNNSIVLTWKVAGEENVARYNVERSSDGRNFATIASVTKTGQNVYSYTDNSALNTVYYRIKNEDNDGKFKYSTILRIANGRADVVLRAFPQPVQNQLTLQHPSVSGRALLSISTADGRVVRTQAPAAGSMQTAVDMSGLQSGMYMLRYSDGSGNIQTLKVMKQ